MGVVDLPQLRAVVHPKGSDFAVTPSWDDNLIGVNCTKRHNTSNVLGSQVWWGSASSWYCVVVWVPKSDDSILRCGDELVRDSWHEPTASNWGSVTLTKEHLWEVWVSESINITFVCCNETLESVRAWAETMDGSKELSLVCNSSVLSICIKAENVSISTRADDTSGWDGSNRSYSESAKVHGEDEHLCLHMEPADVSWRSSSKEVVFSVQTECHADVVSDKVSCVDNLCHQLASLWHELPKSELLGATHGKLIVLCWS